MNWFFLAAALALLLWFFALLYLKAFVQRRTSPDHILGLLHDDVYQLQAEFEAEIDAKTEQILQLLEEKMQAVKDACAEAERRIAVYNRELEKREKETKVLSALSETPSPLPKKQEKKKAREEGGLPKPRSSVPLLERVELAAPADVQAATAYEAADSAYRAQTGQPAAPKIVVSRDVTKQPPIKDRIAELYRAGFALELIAKRMGLTPGEATVYVNLCKLEEDAQSKPKA